MVRPRQELEGAAKQVDEVRFESDSGMVYSYLSGGINIRSGWTYYKFPPSKVDSDHKFVSLYDRS